MHKHFNTIAASLVAFVGLVTQAQDAKAEEFYCKSLEGSRTANILTRHSGQGFTNFYAKDNEPTVAENMRKVIGVEGKIDFRAASRAAATYCETGKLPLFETLILPAGEKGLRLMERHTCDMGPGKKI
jgi:hypothetical protein